MGIWITTNLSIIWRDRTGALLPAIQFLRFFLMHVGPDFQLVWFNRPLVVMSPASLYQLKIWPKTHSMNKSVQQGFFSGLLGRIHERAYVKTDWHLRHLYLTLSIVSYLYLCFYETARKVYEWNQSGKLSCLCAGVLDVFLLCLVSVRGGQWS